MTKEEHYKYMTQIMKNMVITEWPKKVSKEIPVMDSKDFDTLIIGDAIGDTFSDENYTSMPKQIIEVDIEKEERLNLSHLLSRKEILLLDIKRIEEELNSLDIIPTETLKLLGYNLLVKTDLVRIFKKNHNELHTDSEIVIDRSIPNIVRITCFVEKTSKVLTDEYYKINSIDELRNLLINKNLL